MPRITPHGRRPRKPLTDSILPCSSDCLANKSFTLSVMENQCEEFRDLLQTMSSSLETARTSLQAIKEKQQNLDMTNGISLLSLKHQVFVSYLHSLVLLSGRRLLGHSLRERSPPSLPFGSQDRERRGSNAGDLVDSMIEGRLVLEKIDTLESKMRYQIEKLVRIADAPARNSDTMEGMYSNNLPLYYTHILNRSSCIQAESPSSHK